MSHSSLLCSFVILCVFSVTHASSNHQSEVVSVISLQLDYIKLEKSLWAFLESSSSKYSESSKLDKLFETHISIVSEHYTADLELLRYSVLLNDPNWANNVTEDLSSRVWMDTVYTLTKFEGLFKFFRGFLNRYYENEYEKQALLDLCRDVLDDNANSVNIPGVIDQIQTVMYKLYHRAMLVCRFIFFYIFHFFFLNYI